MPRPAAIAHAQPRAAAPTAANPFSDGPRVTVAMFQDVIAYRTAGATWVTADLWHADGSHYTGYGVSSVNLAGDGDGAGIRFLGFRNVRAVIVPGDRIVVADPVHGTTTIDVPDVVADYDPARHAIVVRAPEGSVVRAHLAIADRRGSDLEMDVTLAAAAGPELIVHSLGGILAADDVTSMYGWVTVDPPDGIRYLQMVGSLSVHVVGWDRSVGVRGSGAGSFGYEHRAASGMVSVGDPIFTGAGAWPIVLPDPPGHGDTLNVRYRNPRLDIDTHRDYRFDEDHLVINPSAYTAAAKQPGLGSLRVTLRTIVAGAPSRVFPADADGSVTADLMTVLPRAPGHIVDAELRSTALSWTDRRPLPIVRVGVGIGVVGATGEIAEANPAAGLRIWNAGGGVKLSQTRFSLGRDGWAYAFVSSLRILPGDRLEIEAFGGDPLWIDVPELSAHYDAARHSIVGTAPPSVPVTAVVRGYVGLPARSAVSGADGRFAIPLVDLLADLADVRRGLHGTVDIGIDAATGAFTTWAAPRVIYTVGRTFFSVRGAPGKDVTVTVADPSGMVRYDRTATLDDEQLRWEPTSVGTSKEIAPIDRYGRAMTIAPGLRITATVEGDAPFGWIIPKVTFERTPDGILVRPDRPFAAADICADDLSTGTEVCTASIDVDGTLPPTQTEFRFTLDLGEIDETTLTARLYTLHEAATIAFTLPRLTIDADEGTVGAIGLSGGGRYRVLARRGGGEVATALLEADAVGRASARLATPGGQSIALAAGDEVDVVAGDGAVVASVAILAVAVERLDGDVVGGRIMPRAPARLHVRMDRLFGAPDRDDRDHADFSQAVAAVDASGRFTATLTPSRDYARAAVVTFSAHDGHGHTVLRRHHAPLLLIGVDSDTLCGATGVPGATVHVALTNGGGGAAITRTLQSGTSGWFALHGGPELHFAPGDRVTVTMDGPAPGTSHVIAADVPALAVTRDIPQYASRLKLAGARPGDALFTSTSDDLLCADGPPRAFERRPKASAVGADGRITRIDADMRVGHALDHALVPPDGGPIFFRRFVAGGVRIQLDTGAITVPLSTFKAGRLTLTDAAGRTRHAVDVRTTDVPLARVALPAAAMPRTGDVILAALDGVTDTIPIEPFTFERRADGEWTGSVYDPDRVRIRFTLADGRVVHTAPSRLGWDTFAIEASAAADVEAVFGAAVSAVEAVVVVNFGHELVRAPSAPGAVPSPTATGTGGGVGAGGGGRIWLPFGLRYVRRR